MEFGTLLTALLDGFESGFETKMGPLQIVSDPRFSMLWCPVTQTSLQPVVPSAPLLSWSNVCVRAWSATASLQHKANPETKQFATVCFKCPPFSHKNVLFLGEKPPFFSLANENFRCIRLDTTAHMAQEIFHVIGVSRRSHRWPGPWLTEQHHGWSILKFTFQKAIPKTGKRWKTPKQFVKISSW